MTVLFFCNLVTGKLGAFEHLVLEIGRRLAANGDRLIVMFGAPPIGPVPAALAEAGIEWGHIEGWGSETGHVRPWRFVRSALTAIRQYKPDLVAVHFGNEIPVLVASLLNKCLARHAPVWVWHQRQQVTPPSPLARKLSRIRIVGMGVDHYIVSYEGGRESLLARGIPPGHITRIYNAVPQFTSRRPAGWLRQELSLPDNAILALNVGWLVPRKRIDIAIRAFAKAVRGIPNGVLLVAGEGPERAALEATVHALNMDSQVRFLGARSDVRELMMECDCLIHSSIAETCTNVVNESMAAGIPAVIMNAGAATEQIADGFSGYVVGPHDEKTLAERLEAVLRSKESRRMMGVAARQRWKAFFNLELTAAEHCELYRNLLERTPC